MTAVLTKLNGLAAAKAAVLEGRRVYWGNQSGYELRQAPKMAGGWMIVCTGNGHVAAVHYRDGVRSDYTAAEFCFDANAPVQS